MSKTTSRRQVAAKKSKFRDITGEVDSLKSDPRLAGEIASIRADLRRAERRHEMTLAMVRRASDFTQTDLAERLGVSQAAVAKTEQRGDMLLSTLNAYLAAAGAEAKIVVKLADGTVAAVALADF